MRTAIAFLVFLATAAFGADPGLGLGPVPISGGGAGVFSSVTDSGLTSGRVPFASTGGLLTDASTLLYSASAGLTANKLTSSGLTSGRVTTAGTAGLLADFANFTYNGTTLTVPALTLSTTPLPVASGGTASSTAATARVALGVAQFDWPGQLEAPTAKTYYVIPTATTGYTFTSVTIYTISGTCTANFSIGATHGAAVSITGASAIAVTSTPQTIALSAANALTATNTLYLDITAPAGPAVDLTYNLGYTR